MKRARGIAAGFLGLVLLFGCGAQAKVIDSRTDTEKIQIVGQIETAAPTEAVKETAVPLATAAVSESSASDAVTPQPIVVSDPTTPEPTAVGGVDPDAPLETEEPTEEPTEAPTEAPTPEPTATPEPNRTEAEKFCDIAESLLDVAYKRGGTKLETGFDPGGFVYYCLNKVGVKVKHKTSKGYSEYDAWQRVDSMDDLEPGDLCFFMTPGNDSVNCVAVYLGNVQIIYPSSGEGKVITNRITSSYWTEAFVFARRVF